MEGKIMKYDDNVENILQSEKPKKHNIEGYEEKFCIEFAGKYIVLAENSAATEPYLVCNIKYDNPFNMEERYDGAVTDNYIEAMREFVKRVDGLVETLETERRESGLPFQTLTAAECIPDSQNADWKGKLIIIKPEILAPEFRSAEHQLALCTGGFGAGAKARGRAVFVKELHSGQNCRYDRHQIAGLADPKKIPNWAIDKLLEYHKKDELSVHADIIPKSDNKPQEKAAETPKKKLTLQEKLDAAKEKTRKSDSQKVEHSDLPTEQAGKTKKNHDERA
jgi:hypothetical protein